MGSNSGGFIDNGFVPRMAGGRGDLRGQGWRPVVGPDCRLAGSEASRDASDAAAGHGRCDAFSAARHRADLLSVLFPFSPPKLFALAVVARLRHPAELSLI